MKFQLRQPFDAPASAHPDLLWQRYLVPGLDRDIYETPTLTEWQRVTDFKPGQEYTDAYNRWKRTVAALPHHLLLEL